MEDKKEKDKVVASVEEFEKKAAQEDKKKEKKTENKPENKVEEKTEEKDSSIEISSVEELKSNTGNASSRVEVIEKNKRERKAKKTKKRIRTLVILLIIGFGLWLGGRYIGYRVSQGIEMISDKTQIGDVQRMDISETISTTGTVQSKDTRTITSALTGVTISKVNYEVGDMVNAGDVIVEFSREDIQDSINQAQEDLDEAKKTKAVADSYRATDHNYDHETANYTVASAANNTAQSLEGLNQANASLQRARDDKNRYVEKYNTAINNLPGVQAEYDQASAYFDLFKATNKQVTLEQGDFPNGNTYAEQDIINYLGYEYTVDEFENYISNLQSQISSYKSTISSYDTSSYDKSIASAEESLRSRELSYQSSLISEGNSNTSTNKSLNTSDYNYDSYLITAGDSVTKAERTLKQQQDKLDDYIVYAPISGIVTSVSAQEGNGYVNTSGGLMTIQSIDSYEISTQIDEYDINNVAQGQKVVIMTDATGEDELEGVVSFISPITTASSSSSGSASQTSSGGNTYEVKIDILTDDARVKLGMSAKLNIIMNTHTNVLSVPYDAIEEDEDGKNYVMVVTDPKVISDANGGKDESGIMVEGINGKPTGSSDSATKTVSNNEGNKQSFIKYLFSSKEDRKKVIKDAAGLASAGKKVYVTIGIEDDYYTEIISDDIKEGDSVILNTDLGVSDLPFGMMGGPGGPGM